MLQSVWDTKQLVYCSFPTKIQHPHEEKRVCMQCGSQLEMLVRMTEFLTEILQNTSVRSAVLFPNVQKQVCSNTFTLKSVAVGQVLVNEVQISEF